MPRLDASIDIKAPSEKVFAYIADVASQPQWCKWAKEAEVTSIGQHGVGTTDEMLMQVGARKERVEGIVTEYREGELFSRRHTRGMEMSESYALEPDGDVTKLAWTIEYTPPSGAFGRLMNLIFVERLFEQLQGDSLNNLKERLESAK